MEIPAIPETPDQLRKRLDAVKHRLNRAYASHRKEVLMVDPTLGHMLVADGFAELAAIADYDPGGDRKFRFDPKLHLPIRIRKPTIAVA